MPTQTLNRPTTKKKKPVSTKKTTTTSRRASATRTSPTRKTPQKAAPRSSAKKTAKKKVAPSSKQNSKKTVLKIENLKKSFKGSEGSTFTILKGVNLAAKQGETIAIMGRSGSGKSTLISIVTGLEKTDSGSVVIDEQNITQLSEDELTEFRAKNIAIIFQQFHLISHLNALDNVALPLQLTGVRENVLNRAQSALEQVGLSHRQKQLPSKLSGGEQQRLAIARSLVVKPALLLADEPTGNLDEETSRQVIDQLFNVVKTNNITLFLVTHDLALAKRCQRRYHLTDGILKPFK